MKGSGIIAARISSTYFASAVPAATIAVREIRTILTKLSLKAFCDCARKTESRDARDVAARGASGGFSWALS
jgi:hypothetical protein